MVKKLTWVGVILIFLSICYVPTFVSAERPSEGIGKWLAEVGIFTGFCEGSLKYSKDFAAVPIGLRFGFDLKPFTKKFGLDPKGLLELVYEPFINPVTRPRSNVETGLAILLKYAYPLTEKLYPYIEAGTGFDYMTLHTYEQGTQFNFLEQGGVGLSYFFKENIALDVCFRYRHISNAGFERPNGGLESKAYLIGVSWFF